VYLLDEGTVCKLERRDAIIHEHSLISKLEDIPFLALGVSNDENSTQAVPIEVWISNGQVERC